VYDVNAVLAHNSNLHARMEGSPKDIFGIDVAYVPWTNPEICLLPPFEVVLGICRCMQRVDSEAAQQPNQATNHYRCRTEVMNDAWVLARPRK
jgi:hypothetical protein